jgi:DNA helicase HerA-like ATPase
MPKEVALLDDLLIKAAAGGKSGDEIERLTGIPAAQAVLHVKQLLATRDIWTEQEQRQLLLSELHELKDSLSDHAIKAGDPDSARLLLKTLELIGKRLDSQQQVLDENMIKLSHFQERVLLRAMDAALNFAKDQLAERYPEITRSELEGIVADGLQKAKYEIAEDEPV